MLTFFFTFAKRKKHFIMSYIDSASEDVFASSVEEDVRQHNREMNLAWQFIASTNMSVFLTGKAGTGKTTFLRKFREITPKRMVVLAPTGVAAINAQGQTIHSFFQLPFGPNIPGQQGERKSYYKVSKEKKNLIRTLDLLVIDEISMVRCDVLDAIDTELRKYRDHSKPFGGVQLLLIGDLQQLAPVAQEREWSLLSPYYTTPYFFGSHALEQIEYVTVELQHIYRQQDADFINVLAKIRTNNIDDSVIQALNSRYVKDFVPPVGEDWIRLTTHNRMAQEYNDKMLQSLHAEPMTFHAEVHRNFPETSYPADEALLLKTGAQVMFIKNDPSAAKEYYNGKIGVVQGVEWDNDGENMLIRVFCKEDGKTILVSKVVWENTKYVIDDKTGDIREEVEGTFTQYPLRLAWAITVHKSQGLTFDHAVLDINDSFTHGQVYVALSRCRTLQGMILSRPLALRSVITDASVNAYIDKELAEAQQTEDKLPQMKYEYYFHLLNEMFDFRTLKSDLGYMVRVVGEHLAASYPDFLSIMKDSYAKLDADIITVALKFGNQYQQLMAQSQGNFAKDEKLNERLMAAMGYFQKKLHELLDPVMASTKLVINNKQVKNQYNNALDAFTLSYKMKTGVFSRLLSTGFSVRGYLNAKALASLDEVKVSEDGVSISNAASKKKKKEEKEAKEKKPKVDTRAESYRLFREGNTIAEIAKQRSLTEGTIAGHLATYIEKGDVNLNELVSTQHQNIIRGVARSFGNKACTISEVKALLPDDYTYAEIKLVLTN